MGYSTCYWCHVMEREVFSDPEIAAYMNAHFVNVKVDREERPDLDEIYMRATMLIRGAGGWPNSLFLTPAGKPFFAGTYFPAEDAPGRPGFPRILHELVSVWNEDRERLERASEQVAQRLERAFEHAPSESETPPEPGALLAATLERLTPQYDSEHGGFGGPTKFPQPPVLDVLLTALERAPERDPELERQLSHTLDAMALGGIYDQLGGGFHRYATEPSWSVPHFEKMLYDNAQLAEVYARAYALLGRPLYRRVAEQTLAYLEREMTHPEGGFYSAQDAEVGGREGASYLWSRAELEQVLGSERARAWLEVYALVPVPELPLSPPAPSAARERPDAEGAAGVLRVRLAHRSAEPDGAPVDWAARLAALDASRAELLRARAARPQPRRDDKLLTAWNALAIRALVRAADALDRLEYLERAERLARFVLTRLRGTDGTLRRSYVAGLARERAVLEDHALLADALIALHGARPGAPWLDEARTLADTLLESFEDPEGGGFYTAAGGGELFVKPKPFDDSVLPSGNAAALRVLLALAALEPSPRYERAAARTVRTASGLLERAPDALGSSVAALAAAPERALRAAGESGARRSSAARREPQPGRATRALPESRDHVRATLVPESAGRWSARVQIDAGWHIQAQPASLPYLIATELQLDGAGDGAEIRYPAGEPLEASFSGGAPLRVYAGEIGIELRLPAGSAPPRGARLRVQACDAERCLPPSAIELRLAP